MTLSNSNFDTLILESDAGLEYLSGIAIDLLKSTGDSTNPKSVQDSVEIFAQDPEHFSNAARSESSATGGVTNLFGSDVSPLLMLALPVLVQVTKMILEKLAERAVEQSVDVSLDALKEWVFTRHTKACLAVTWPDDRRTLHVLKDEVFRVGRMEKENQLVLRSASQVKDLHLEVIKDKEGFRLKDLNTGGTFVNGERIDGFRRLVDRDEITFSGEGAPRLTFLNNYKNSPLMLDAARVNAIRQRLDLLSADYNISEQNRLELERLLLNPVAAPLNMQ
jgi:pSer/pThr/pTyr-binding forkhead associated (FHA) protein